MKAYLTQKNLIILGIIVVLLVVGITLKKRQALAPVVTDDVNSGISDVPDTGDSTGSTDQTSQTEPKNLTYDEYLQQGIKYETKREFLKAIESYKKASVLAPKEYVPYSNIGSAYFKLKKYADAESNLLKALELSPGSVSVYTKLYEVYYYGLKRNPEQMIGFFNDAMKNTDNNINIVKLYAFYLETINDPESALTIYQSLLKFEPENTAYKAKVEALQKKIAELQ